MIFVKNTGKYDVFCILGKDGISFSCKYEITLLSKNDLLKKNTHKNDIFVIPKKDHTHRRKDDIGILD